MTIHDVHGIPVTLTETGHGHPVLLLHGGGGPSTVAAWGQRLASERPARVITPVHPGFNRTLRPDSVRTVRDLAALYVDLLDELDLEDVSIVGNSIGGWIAAEVAALNSPRISSVVIVDGVGLAVEDHPYVDFFSLTPAQVAEHSYADPGGPMASTPPPCLPRCARSFSATVNRSPSMADRKWRTPHSPNGSPT